MSQPDQSNSSRVTKFQRYRQRKQNGGMKLLRVWVRDPHTSGFATEAARQGLLLRGHPDETDAIAFIAAAFHWPE